MRRFLTLLCLVGISQLTFAQLTATGFDSRSLTAYTNGASNDSIYFYCDGALGSLTATSTSGTAPFDFAWQQFSTVVNGYEAFSTENDVTTSTISNLQPGGYRVTITDANGIIVGCDRAWIAQVLSNPSVNVNPIPPGCGTVSLNGQITHATATPYYNPPPDPMIINDATQIQVCFSGNHTYVSDVAFYFVGPTTCGSPTILLSPSPGVCNGGDNINNLCFTDQPAPNFNVCTAPVPLTGTYDSYGTGNTLINWAPLNGCNAAASGWRVQIYDCVGADTGALTDATITFTGQDGCGNPQSIIYTTPAGFNSPIADNSCSAATASVFTVPTFSTAAIPYTNGHIWTASPTINIPNATTSLTPVVNPGPQVNTTFTLTITGNGPGAACGGNNSDSEERIFSVPSTPEITFAPETYCIGDPAINLIATPSGGTWTGPGITNATTGLWNPNFAGAAGVKTLTYTINSGGCVVTAQTTITLQASANTTITDPGALCLSGAVVDLNAPSAGGTWSGSGIIDPAQGLFDPSVSGAGTFTVTYFIPNVCYGTGTIDITVAEDGASIVNDPGQICEGGGTVILNGTPAGGVWSGPGIVNANTGEFDPSLTGAGLFTVNYDFTNGCVESSTYDVEVIPSANTSIVDPGYICYIDGIVDLALTNEVTTGQWSGNGIIDSTTGAFDPTVAGSGTHTISYTIPGVCDGNLSIEVTVSPNIIAEITGPSDVCITSTPFDFTSNVTGGTWSGPGITNAANGTFNPSTAGLGTHIISLETNDPCIASTTFTIVVSEFVDATITDVAPICEDAASFQLVAVTPGGTWTGTGVSASGLFNPNLANVGNNTITYTITGTCSGSDQTTIIVAGIPTITITNPGPICINDAPEQITATPIGGVWSGVGVTPNGVFTAGTAGVGAETLTYTITGVCSASQTVNVNVVALPVVSAGADLEVCAGATVTLTATGAASYVWTGGVFSPTSASTQAQPSVTNTYTVTGTDANNCSSSDQVTVVVNPLPIVNILNNNPFICEDGEVELVATGLTSYQWSPSAGLSTAFGSTTTASPATTTVYTVSGTDANGCAGSDQVTVGVTIINVTINPYYVGANNVLTPNPSGSSYGGMLPFTAAFDVNSNADSFEWDFGNGDTDESFSAGQDVFTQYTEEQIFNVTVTAFLDGCSETNTFSVDIFGISSVLIPNIVTNNGDGENDVYKVQGIFLREFRMMIYDRNGQFVAELKNENDTWSPKGDFNDGTYFYFYEATGKDGKSYSGEGAIQVLSGK
jgi:gliding motility-associated-like protein